MSFKYVIDTFAWVEFGLGSESGIIVGQFLDRAECYTPTIVIAELSFKFTRENLTVEWGKMYSYLKMKTSIIPLDETLADQAGAQKNLLRKLQPKEARPIGLADAIIY